MENKKIVAAIIGICIFGGFALVLILDWYFSRNILELILAFGIIVLLLFGSVKLVFAKRCCLISFAGLPECGLVNKCVRLIFVWCGLLVGR